MFSCLFLLSFVCPQSEGMAGDQKLLHSFRQTGFRCPPCEHTKCSNGWCPGERVMDTCNCCLVCAKEETQLCGGYHNEFGACRIGLTCSQTGHWKHVGVCIKKRCPENQVYMTCGTGCPKKCGQVDSESCTKRCIDGCGCPRGLPFMKPSRECVQKSGCS